MGGLKFIYGCLLGCLFWLSGTEHVFSQVSQDDDFDAYQSAIISDFYAFEDSIHVDFANFLEQAWQEFTVYEGTEPPRYSKVIPDYVVCSSGRLAVNNPKQTAPDNRFFGTVVEPTSLPGKLFSLPGVGEKQVAEGWRSLSKENFTSLFDDCRNYTEKLHLNGWGAFLLVKHISRHGYASFSSSERTLFLFYVLSNWGYKVKIGRGEGNTLVLLLPFKEEVYRMPYVRMGNVKYYVMDTDNANLKTLYSFDAEYPPAHKTLSFSVPEALCFPEERIIRKFTGKYVLSVELNKHLLDFYATYPLCDLSVYFQSKVSAGFHVSLGRYIEKQLDGKSRLACVSWLLDFVQQLFIHKSDELVYGKEMYYFPEEVCHYPYADCEDLSVFLFYLLRLYTDRKVLVLYYPSHVALAVENCAGYKGKLLKYGEKEYMICDPSYKGAAPGRVIPACTTQKPVIVSYE